MSRFRPKPEISDGTDVPKDPEMRPVRYVETLDGRSIAWTRSGAGPPLVKAGAWLTHLEYDDESPVWSNYVSFLESNFDYVRYDERGCGMSDRDPGRLDIEAWTDDLRRVVQAANLPKPFVIFAMSQGTFAALSYAAQYPEDVSQIVLLGGYSRGVYHRDDPVASEFYDAIIKIFSIGFDDPNTAFREVFTRRFLPDGSPQKVEWFNELCQRTTTPEVGAQLLKARADLDASHILKSVVTPTLIMHAEGDEVVPVSEGRFMAQRIKDAQLSILNSRNHILQVDESAWGAFCRAVLEFTNNLPKKTLDDLTSRENTILEAICEAKSNKEIARLLDVSEKTVRNHATHIFAKLGVSSRQEAILEMQKRNK